MSADSRYKLSMLLDLLHKQFGLRPEFHAGSWHVPDPSAYWQLIACGKCAKEVSDANLKLDVLEDALKQAGVKWRYDNGGATCNVKLPNYQLGLGYVPVQGHKTFHGFTIPDGIGFYQHERDRSITITEDAMCAMLTQARWEGLNAQSVLGAFMGPYETKPSTYSREVYTRDAEGNVTFKRDPDKDVPDWVLAFDNKVTPAPHGWKLSDGYLAYHGNNLRAFLDVGWDIESLKAHNILVRDDANVHGICKAFGVPTDAGFTSPIKVKEIHGVRVPKNVSLTIRQDGWLRVSIDGLRQLLLDATLRVSPAKVD